ncbi:MRD1, partial [Cucurbita argyrosperma subsp. argyrosperma]
MLSSRLHLVLSRICVKNLPKHIDDHRLRTLFSEKGEITDVKLMRTKDGKSRQFAFIGFRTEHEAQEAIRYFNKSFLNTHRIACEIAWKVGDPKIPRPWSKHSKEEKGTKDKTEVEDDKSKSLLGSKKEGDNLKLRIQDDDPKIQEFLQVTQPRINSKLWANDTLTAPEDGKSKEKASKMKTVGGRRMELVNVDGDKAEETQTALHKNPAHDDKISDMEYFKSRVKKTWSDSETSDVDNSDEDESIKKKLEIRDVPMVDSKLPLKTKAKEEGHSNHCDADILNREKSSSTLEDKKDEMLESGRLFVRNLPYAATEEELEEHFRRYGTVSEVHLVVDKDTRRSKGIAYILYTVPESAKRALEELDNSIFQGRLLHIMPAQLRKISEKPEENILEGQRSKSFKQKREEERKASEASGNTKAWNSLFMRPDTVVENIARKYGVSKGELLDGEADDLAVRVALGETQVVAETKNALTNAGVNVASLEEFASGKADGHKRSNHILLVKNLPYGSSEGELANMFGKFGSLDKIILPPTKILALVIFLEPSVARAAFKGLAYKRYKDAPLYLEWAPDNILSHNPMPGHVKDEKVGEGDARRVILEQAVEGISDVDFDPDRVESRSLFVKNLNFKTTDESLRKHFSENMKEGRILSAKVKKHIKKGQHVSMGFGFLEFDSVETATRVCSNLQGTVLDSHALILQMCHVKKDDQGQRKVDKEKSSTKILVRNVAFEATGKDLRQLFSPYGQIKSLRLPMKFGKHRGFAFVEYVTKQEAQNAFQALSNTHLYGRHLVLERAKEGETLEELRARTAAQFSNDRDKSQNPVLSKKRKQVDDFEEDSKKFLRTD